MGPACFHTLPQWRVVPIPLLHLNSRVHTSHNVIEYKYKNKKIEYKYNYTEKARCQGLRGWVEYIFDIVNAEFFFRLMGVEHWIKISHFSAYCILRWNWFFLKITDISIQAAVGVSCKWSQGAAFPSTSIHTLKESKLFWTSVFFFCVSRIFYPHLKRIYTFQEFCFLLFGFLEFSIRTLKESKLFPTAFSFLVRF